ncbi:DnaJ domain-containing protein [Polycladidibacter hongkongensis]|uniref:DnaJ domain-containing protein n=1 Tax=Polycladidibacter hongkongensis TaxID=1647556 RepID=UPI00082AE69D|nr:DnaJ domain-containing protein [Pseudovibrio hongkongensis]
MAFFVAGLLGLALLVFFAKLAARGSPQKMLLYLKQFAGLALCLLAIVFIATGRWAAGLPLFMLAASLFGVAVPRFGIAAISRHLFGNLFQGQRASSGLNRSTVRSNLFEMQLDHESGQLDGEILSGPFMGAKLSGLPLEELRKVWQNAAGDQESLALLEAYLDRRFSNWRVNFQAHSASGQSNASGSGGLTDQEAYEILGLRPGADASEIRAAHRRLIKRMHPDSGGSAFLAAKLNEAKDRLLNRHE